MNGSNRIQGRHGRLHRTGVVAAPERTGRFFSFSILCVVLAACSPTGDFGRPRPTLWNQVVLPTAGTVAAIGRGEPASLFPFTDDEEELRDRAWRFLMPAKERDWFDAQLAELVRTRVLPASARPFERNSYFQAVMNEDFASGASRFRRIGEDAEADLLLIDPFHAVAARVVAADRARLSSLAFMRELSEEEIAQAAARVAENRCLIAWVRTSLHERTESYRYAVEHAFVMMPQGEALGAERAVRALDVHRRSLNALPVAAWRDGACWIPTIEQRVRAPLVVKG
jgi:hypothetical protein